MFIIRFNFTILVLIPLGLVMQFGLVLKHYGPGWICTFCFYFCAIQLHKTVEYLYLTPFRIGLGGDQLARNIFKIISPSYGLGGDFQQGTFSRTLVMTIHPTVYHRTIRLLVFRTPTSTIKTEIQLKSKRNFLQKKTRPIYDETWVSTAEAIELIPHISCPRHSLQYPLSPHFFPHEFLMIQYGLLLSRKIENPFDPYPTRSTPWFNLFLLHISGHDTPPMYVCMNTAFIPTVSNRKQSSSVCQVHTKKYCF